MNMTLGKPLGKKNGAPARGKLPAKRTVNLAMAGVETMNMKAAAVGIVLIVAAAVLFGKFAVADRLAAVNRAQRRVAEANSELQQTYDKIASFGDIEDVYAHYTYAGMTEEELSLVERADVIRVIEEELGSKEADSSWSLTGNVLTLTVTGNSLQEINLLARRLEEHELVELCTVTNAAMNDTGTSRSQSALPAGTVRANIIAYLVSEEEGGSQ